ncbi:MAG: GspH/FimT family pseudopilin [Gammaproteobacteria bacterium]|nr:GspH/FimT family pseudopilin [Gammaproteobacteria bacterium]
MTMKRISGFTLLELMMVLVIAAILLGIGVPSMQEFIKNNRLITINNEFVSSLQVARSAAIQHSGVAYVCASSTVNNAVPVCNNSNNWESGWMAFLDTAGDGVFNPADPENDVLLKVWDGVPFSSQVSVRTNSANINAVHYVRFNSRGLPTTATGVGLQGMFKICDDRGLMHPDGITVLGKGITLSASGSVRTTRDSAQIVSCL